MPTHPTAPGPSSADLKNRVGNFMRRAEEILTHPLADYIPGITVTFQLDENDEPVAATMSHDLADREAMVFLASLMRPIIYLRDDPISLEKLTAQIEREHVGFRGKIKPFRKAFLAWLQTPLIMGGTIGEVPAELRTDGPDLVVTNIVTAPVGTPMPVDELKTDMYFAELYFYAELWHSDLAKSAEYEASTDNEKDFIAKCAEVRTWHAIPFIRTLHDWVVAVRAMGMDI